MWLLMDQVMHPQVRMEEGERGGGASAPAGGAAARETKLPPSLETFKMPKSEILHIMKAPFGMLTRRK